MKGGNCSRQGKETSETFYKTEKSITWTKGTSRDGPGGGAGGAGGAGQSGGQGSGGNARGGRGQADRNETKDNEGQFSSGGGKGSASGRQHGGWAEKENFSDDSEAGDSRADPMLHVRFSIWSHRSYN